MNNTEGMFGAASKRIRMPICDRTLTNEFSNDYTLPDYQPEIRRLLNIRATILPPAKYVSTGGAEFNGTVDYTVLYVGADGELYTTPLSAEYSFNTPIDSDNAFDFNEGITACADIDLENITTRLSGPRKINIKSRMKAHTRAYAVMMFDEKMSGETDPLSIERLEEKSAVCTFVHGTGDIFELSEEIIPETPNCRVISADGKVFISEVDTAEARVNLRGDVYMTLLTTSEERGGEVNYIQRKIPFNGDVELDELTADCNCSAKGHISDISVNVEDGRIICDMSVVFEIEAQKSEPFEYTKDIYSTENACECSYRDYKIPTAGYCINGNFSMNERMTKENIGFPENAVIIDTYGTATADKLESHNGKNVIMGQVKYVILVLSNGEYSTVEAILPLKYEFDADSSNISSSDASISIISCRTRQDSDSISIDAELGVSAWGAGSEEIIALREVKFGDKIKKNKGDIIIYYLTPEDTLWSVAKKYNVSSRDLERANNINATVDGKEYLIV